MQIESVKTKSLAQNSSPNEALSAFLTSGMAEIPGKPRAVAKAIDLPGNSWWFPRNPCHSDRKERGLNVSMHYGSRELTCITENKKR